MDGAAQRERGRWEPAVVSRRRSPRSCGPKAGVSWQVGAAGETADTGLPSKAEIRSLGGHKRSVIGALRPSRRDGRSFSWVPRKREGHEVANQYKKTMNLPKTKFSMRAGLAQHEPERLKDWDENDVYGQLLKKNEGHEKFVPHDGPPYANGPIHLGHA